MSAPWRGASLRARLLGSVAIGTALALGGLVLAFNLVLASRLDGEADGLARAQAAAQISALQVTGGQIRLPDAADARNPDSEVWVFQGGTRSSGRAPPRERPRCRAARPARSGLPRHRRHRDTPVRRAGGANQPNRRGRRRCQPRRVRGDAAHRAARFGDPRRLHRTAGPDRRTVADRPRARAGGDDDPPGLGVERARPRPTLQPRRGGGRDRSAGHHPQRAARTAQREPPSRATPLGRDLPRAAHPAGQRHRRGAVRQTPRIRGPDAHPHPRTFAGTATHA